MSGRFDQRVVLITGASAGIGAHCAQRFADLGARLILVARGAERLEAMAEGLRAKGAEVLTVAMDVSDTKACEALVARALSECGGVDVLVNNAGAHNRGPFVDQGVEDLAVTIDVNLRAPLVLMRLVLPHMLKQGRGAVVNVASIAGCVPLPNSAAYSASKFGLRALSLAAAQELTGTGVTVSAVSPGPVATGFILDQLDEVSELTLSQPMSSPDAVAAAIVASARDGRYERKIPWRSGKLATTAYLFPWLRHLLRPVMERKGRRAKARLLASDKAHSSDTGAT